MGLASGSALAAATILALSLTDGIKMTRLLDVFDIFFHLSSLGKTQTDDSAHITTIYKRHLILESQEATRSCNAS
jgi:hypothetical protein